MYSCARDLKKEGLNMVDYDSGEVARRCLESLQIFNNVVEARHHAGHYCRGETMRGWVLRGQWIMDSRGDSGKLIHRADLTGVPDVCDWETFEGLLGGSDHYIDGVFTGIPPAGSICSLCEEPWTIDNCHLAVPDNVSQIVWYADPQYVGKRYDQIPRALILGDGIVRVKATILMVKKSEPKILSSEQLTYDYLITGEDKLPFSLWRYIHPEGSC